MSWNVGMPNLGHTMEEGKLASWLKQVGDPVRKGEVIAIVESDKASFDVESPADGVLASIAVDADTIAPVGTVIAVIGAPGAADLASIRPVSICASAGAEPPSPVASAIPLAAVRPARLRISPAARALAEELGIDPQGLTGTGPEGMISREDIRAHAEALKAAGPAGPVPLTPMRRAIAEATSRAWQTIPHVALHARADVGALLERHGEQLTAAIGKAVARALVTHPTLNGWLSEAGFEAAKSVNLACAVSTPEGLVTVVLPEAERKSVGALHAELQDFAAAARAGRIEGASLVGGSFAISSLGRWGVESFAPIIAAPQVAILGIGKIDRVAREAPDGGVRFAREIALTLVFDHRANDGVAAAQCLQDIIANIEDPQKLEALS